MIHIIDFSFLNQFMKIRHYLIPSVLISIGVFVFLKSDLFKEKRVLGASDQPKIIILNDNGFTTLTKTSAKTVADFLKDKNISLNKNDLIYPDKNNPVFYGMKIKIKRAKSISVFLDGENKSLFGFGETIADILRENNISLRPEDIVKPSRQAFAYNNIQIKIIRVEIKKETSEEKIAFKTITKEDAQLGWRNKKIKQQGVPGVRKITYQVAYHDGKEVSRKKISSEIIKQPLPQIIVQGTYIKFGKKHKGVASWYAHTGTMSAANPWLPLGSYVKVTNLDNGKSVIVRINDRGPFGNGRIIDLDKVAFAKIAPLGQGTVRVKMEEILN